MVNASAKKAATAASKQKAAGSKSSSIGPVAAMAAVVVAAVAFELSGFRASLAREADTPGAEDIDFTHLASRVSQDRAAEEATLPCTDDDTNCVSWARNGECDANKGYMHRNCRKSCGICGGNPVKVHKVETGSSGACEDTHRMCATWASIGECETNAGFMHKSCPVTCRLCQSDSCKDMRDDCEERSKLGGCYTIPGMREQCAWTCVACDLGLEKKCERDHKQTPAATPGSGDAMFERIALMDSVGFEGRGMVRVHSHYPWVITIDGFLSPDECDALLAAGGTDWSRSLAGDGEQAVRTSSTSWCRAKCLQDPVVQEVQKRVSALTGVPTENAEFMQVLRYEEGQFYKVHHDQNSPRSSAWGPRLYTFFMYLSDVDAGGGTRFPKLNITVEPKKGRALFWTSVMDKDPYERDDRTDHEALAVERGVKYAANYWLHMYEFREKSVLGCDNAPYVFNWY